MTGYAMNADYEDVFVDLSASGQENLTGVNNSPEGIEDVSMEALKRYDTYRSRDWPIANGVPATRGAPDAVWRTCADAYPTLVDLGPSTPCDPVDTGLTFALDGASGELLRHVPFDVTLTLRDDAGPVTDGLLDSTIVLSATGGEVPGTLFVAGEDPEALPTATLPAGASSVTFENVVATGLSADAGGDVRLVATGTSGTADGVTATAGPASIRDVTMEVTASPTSIRADGSEAAPIRVRLAAVADDAGVAGETMTFATDLGTFTEGGAPVGTTVTEETDADGVATARLVADGDAGTASVTVRCPGACPKTVTVEMVGDATSIRAVPGDGKAWVYVGSLGADVVNLEVDRGEGFDALDPPSTASPVRLEGLTNGETYDVRVRGRTEGGGVLPPSDAVSVTPGPVAVPAAPVDVAGDAIAVGTAERRPDGRVALPLTLTLTNDTQEAWTDLWIAAPDAGNAWRIDRAEIEPGRAVRDGDRWNLRFDDTPLAPNATATVTFTLLERE
ncbi:MAG: invasin domain 3-containing protein [Trueperaceae bacterium]|nr:invasin domain 3-containing protein [Trueperaceae bacterium]